MNPEDTQYTQTDLLVFELANLVKYVATTASNKPKSGGPPKKKRRYNQNLEVEDLHYKDINEKLKAAQELESKELGALPHIPPVEESSFIVLSNRSLACKAELPLDSHIFIKSGIESNSQSQYELNINDLILKFDEFDLLLISSKKRVRVPQMNLLSLVIPNDKERELIKRELDILRPLPVSKRTENIQITQPALKVLIIPNPSHIDGYTIELELSYKVMIKEGILNLYPNEIIESLQKLLFFHREITVENETEKNICNVHGNRVSPQMFYNAITDSTSNMDDVKTPIVPDLQVDLLPFQGKTVSWLLNKEGMKYNYQTKLSDSEDFVKMNLDSDVQNELIQKEILSGLERVSFGWSKVENLNGYEQFWFNPYTGNLASSELAKKYLVNLNKEIIPAQAILAEEMGLGKTVEMASLILLNQRPFDHLDKEIFHNKLNRHIKQVKTTLIITPDSILGQWMEELENLAPTLKSHHYKGCNISNIQNPYEVAHKLSEYDVVLCSYQTISRELHYAQYNPESRPTRSRSTKARSAVDKQLDLVMKNSDSVLAGIEKDSLEESMQKDVPDDLNPDVLDTLSSNPSQSEPLAVSISDELSKPASEAVDLASLQTDGSLEHYHNDNQSDRPESHESDDHLAHFNSEGLRINYSGGQDSFYDYSSPLMLLQFWRVVLDEVQMVTSKLSNAAKTAKLIPRIHAWGVSGTPIKKDVSDLNSILTFLKFNPFADETIGKKSWANLISNTPDFVKLWKTIALRHTKDMVSNQIKLPMQKRMILSCAFTAVEQDNYNQLLENCLAAIGVDQFGSPVMEDWEPTATIMAYMRQWLIRLRQVCCNSQVGKLNFKKRSQDSLPELRTVEDVLGSMIEESENQLSNLERDLILAKMETGSLEGYDGNPGEAIKIWKKCLPDVARKVGAIQKEIAKFEESNKSISYENASYQQIDERERNLSNLKAKLRSWLGIMHRFLFFMASAHYQCYNIAPNSADPEVVEELEEKNKDDIPDDQLNSYELKHRTDEKDLYSKAEIVRRELLSEPSRKVNSLIEGLLQKDPDHIKKNEIQHINAGENQMSFSIESKVLFDTFCEVADELDAQVVVLNMWYKDLCHVLSKTVLDSSEANGGEYTTSLDDQEKAYSYLEVLQKALADRSDTIIGKAPDITSGKISVYGIEKDALLKSDLYVQLNRARLSIRPATADMIDRSLKHIVLKSKQIQRDLTDAVASGNRNMETEHSMFSKMTDYLSKVFDQQKVSLALLKKEISINLNSIYNARIEYFRQLQQISDTVKPYTPKQLFGLDYVRLSLNRKISDSAHEITKTATRCRYLESLKRNRTVSADENGKEEEEDKFCIICRGSITIGSLTECGHQYCKECLDMWLKNKNICPVCKTRVSPKSIYSFTYTRPELKVKLINESKSQEMFSIYEQMDTKVLNEIQSIGLKHSYGSKVDLIVQQTLWLKRHDPSVQIVVFSQWSDLLYIIGVALRQSGIKFLGSRGTLLPEFGSGRRRAHYADVNEFRRNPAITCFLLNAKAQSSGLTLVNATHVFLCEPLVNSALELQAISRVHRIGQTKPTTVWMFTIENSVEESVVALSTRKRLELIDKTKGVASIRIKGMRAKETDLTKADSVELTTKTDNDMLTKRSGDGEVVDNEDLWAAFFSK